MKSIVIVDLGTGNLRSVSKAVNFVSPDKEVMTTSDPGQIANADYLILPGQGAIGTWFDQLNSSPLLKDAVEQRLADGPVLGICLGLQALYSQSEENNGTQGLAILKGQVKHFSTHQCHDSVHDDSVHDSVHDSGHNNNQYKVPHMGWNNVSIVNDHPLWHGLNEGERFYFVHSYYVESQVQSEIAGLCQYGNEFTAAAASKNLFATQFHPEKSQQAGLKLLTNFTNWDGTF